MQFAEAYTIGIVTASFARAGEGELVVQALAITFVVFFALTIFTFQSKIDFSFLGGILFASTWVLIIWGLIGAIFGFRPGFIYSLIGAVLFSMYIVFDTYLLMDKVSCSLLHDFLVLLHMCSKTTRKSHQPPHTISVSTARLFRMAAC
jgi:FtsH-binding integral membrane protein